MRPGAALPIGYVEVQRSWLDSENTPDHVRDVITEIREKMAREEPSLVQASARIEVTKDGAGVNHHTIYMGFEPAGSTTEPLDPRNLNDAKNANTAVTPLDADSPARDVALGHKEQRF